jgi:hypothetical protein
MKRVPDCLWPNVERFTGSTNTKANLAIVVPIVSLRHFNEESAFNRVEALPSFRSQQEMGELEKAVPFDGAARRVNAPP